MSKFVLIAFTLFLTSCVKVSIDPSEQIILDDEGLLLFGVKMDGFDGGANSQRVHLDIVLDKFNSFVEQGNNYLTVRAFGPEQLVALKLPPGIYSFGGAEWLHGQSRFESIYACLHFFEVKASSITYPGTLYVGKKELPLSFLFSGSGFNEGILDNKNIFELASEEFPQAFRDYPFTNQFSTKRRCE